jgi:hypothetical protein
MAVPLERIRDDLSDSNRHLTHDRPQLFDAAVGRTLAAASALALTPSGHLNSFEFCLI